MERRAMAWGAATGGLAGLETALLVFAPHEEAALLATLLLILAFFAAAMVVRGRLFLPAPPRIAPRYRPPSGLPS